MNSFFYSIELTYYSKSFLYKAMVNRSSFNVVSTNSSDAHAYEHAYSPNDGSKNHLNNYFYTPLMSQSYSITFNNTIHRFSMSLSQSFF